MTKRPRGISPERLARLVPPNARRPGVSSEAAARAALTRELERRAQACYQELTALLERHGCTLQVVTQEIQIAGREGVNRVCQVNVLALEQPAPPASADAGNHKSASPDREPAA